MSYIDGFVIAVPTANKQKFLDHATESYSPHQVHPKTRRAKRCRRRRGGLRG